MHHLREGILALFCMVCVSSGSIVGTSNENRNSAEISHRAEHNQSLKQQLENLLDEEQMAELNLRARASSCKGLIGAHSLYSLVEALWERMGTYGSWDHRKALADRQSSFQTASSPTSPTSQGKKKSQITSRDAKDMKSTFKRLFQSVETAKDEYSRSHGLTVLVVKLRYLDSTYTPSAAWTVLQSLVETLDISKLRPLEEIPEEVLGAAADLKSIRQQIEILRTQTG